MSTLILEGKQVLVTGAAGFIGSHLAEELARRGARVRAFVRYNSRGSGGWLAETEPELRERIEIFAADVTDARRVREAAVDCDVVWHLAALIGIPYSYEAPASYVRVNVEGTVNVLEAAREIETPRLVVTSTSEVYGTARRAPIGEDHPLQAQSPYAATKIAADKIAESYFASFGLPVVVARPFNTYGPRQSARAVIPTIGCQLVAGRKEIRLGALHPTRDLNFVADTVDGLIACGFAGGETALGEVFNIGSGREISIGDLAKLMIEIRGSEARAISMAERLRPKASEVERLLCDASKAKRLLGWEPKTSLEEGLRLTLEWLESRQGDYRPDAYVV